MEVDLSRLVDALPGLVWTTTPDQTSDFVNQRLREYTGLTDGEVLADGWKTAIHPDDMPEAQARWDACVASGAAGEVEARIRRSDGAYRRFIISTCPLLDGHGQVLGWCGINTDVEDRRLAEEALLARERQFQFVLDGLPAIAALFTPGGKMTFCNRHMLEYLGETFEQVTSHGSGYNFHPDDRDEVLTEWSACVRSGKPFDREARLCRGDGVYLWHRTRVFPLRNAAGEIELWYGLSTDIEATKRGEATLAAEKRLLESVARGVLLPDFLNRLCRELERLSAGTCAGVLLAEGADDRLRLGAGPSLPEGVRTSLDGQTIDRDADPCSLAVALKASVVVADPAKDPKWAASAWASWMGAHGLAACWCAPVLATTGRVLGVLAVYWTGRQDRLVDQQDLIDLFTKIAGIAIERAQAEEALRASETELQRANRYLTGAQRLSRTGSFTWDAERDQHNWAEENLRIWELDPEALTGEAVLAAIHPEDLPAFEAVHARALAKGGDYELFYRIVTPTGGVKHLHTVGQQQVEVTDRFLFIGATQDITEGHLAQEALNRARAQLEHVTRVTALSALTASIAHEVSQPLAGIITNASTCLRMLAAETPNLDGARATAERTIRDANRASEVIQRLRALFARRQLSLEPVDLNDAAREVLTLSAGELQQRQVMLRRGFDEALPPVRGDRVQLQQVILNLVLNAADAMAAVDDRPRDLWLTTARSDPGQVTLRVRDAGVGLEPDVLERLFDPFFTTKAAGMGIGLSISRSIIQSHDGKLWAAPNTDGPGATFAFSIPLEAPAASA